MNRMISLSVLLALIVLLGGMLYKVIAPFVLPLFLAAVLAVICQPLHDYFLRKTGQRAAWAAAFSTSAVVAIIVVPLICCGIELSHQPLNVLDLIFPVACRNRRLKDLRTSLVRIFRRWRVKLLVKLFALRHRLLKCLFL